MKPSSPLLTLAVAFAVAVACSDMTSLNPELEPGGAEQAVGGAKSSYGGSKAKSTASGGAGTSSGGTRSATASGGKTTAGTGASGGGVAPTRGEAGSGGVGGGNAGAATRVGEGGGAQAGGAAAGGGSEPRRTTSPFFSEYVEGTGSNKALELAIVEPGRLDGCAIRIYANGALAASRTIALAGPITPEAPIVICSPQLSASTGVVCDYSETLPFNGNDAIVLACDAEVADSIGQLGTDPGETGWGSGALRTQDRTLRRLCAISAGDRDPSDTFELAADGWTAAGTDAFDGLGVRCEPTLDDGAGGDSGAGGAGGAGGSAGAPASGEAGLGGDLNRFASSLG